MDNQETLTVNTFPIVGIGASAGGLDAFSQLLKNLTLNTGMGFVLIQHLDPHHESVLCSLLAKITKLPVHEVKKDTEVKPNHVYVIASNTQLTIEKGILKVTRRRKLGKLHLPIDRFLQSLAISHQEDAIGVVLSGTASDGTLGLKAIKEAGGITFAQDDSAKYPGMPKSAIASGYVDSVLSAAEIAKILVKLSTHPYLSLPEKTIVPEVSIAGKSDLKTIFYILQRSTGVDFSHYKQTTIKRRILRRMLLHKLPKLSNYIKYIKEQPGEIDLLFQDILINVTSFFREPATFNYLQKHVFPQLIKNRTQKEAIRIWIPGCSTGEEVYTLAIILTEFLEKEALTYSVQIFGTDIDKSAIDKARKGLYTKADLQNVGPKRIERFFNVTESGFSIIKSIRDKCVFAPHNVLTDPPFARLDIVSCCNLLIYLDQYYQEKVMRTFNYALKPEGVLILGKSESTGSSSKLFAQINSEFKIYSKKNMTSKNTVALNLKPTKTNKVDKTDTSIDSEKNEVFDPQKEADNILLNKFMPASVVINDDLEILQFRGSTGIFLEPSSGKASFNLIKMAKNGLGFELRSAVSKVRKSNKVFEKSGILIDDNGIKRSVAIEVMPLRTTEKDLFYLILFKEVSDTPTIAPKTVKLSRSAKDNRIAELEQNLSDTHEDMRSVTEEQEAVNEELQTANEEILSSNEELQSINEELETSKEELESTNEELNTVNEELQNSNDELTLSRDYAEAIISTVQTPLLVLNQNLRIKTANKAFCNTFKVTSTETEGTFIYDLGKGDWNIPELKTLLEEILPLKNSFDQFEVDQNFASIGHKTMLLNARRIVQGDNKGALILLTIEDITEQKILEDRKDEFITIASHELKTPITTIHGYAVLLGKLLKNSSEHKAIIYTTRLTEQINRLIDLVKGLLDVSKMQAGKLALQKEEFNMVELIKDNIEIMQQTTSQHNIKFDENHNGHSEMLIVADKYRIGQVMINLITNAIKYSPQANVINVLTKVKDEKIYVSIQDFGIGISKNDRKKIFERFFQVENDNIRSDSGMGLGLYISEDIISRHGGKLWVESDEGKGSIFTFSLPLVQNE